MDWASHPAVYCLAFGACFRFRFQVFLYIVSISAFRPFTERVAYASKIMRIQITYYRPHSVLHLGNEVPDFLLAEDLEAALHPRPGSCAARANLRSVRRRLGDPGCDDGELDILFIELLLHDLLEDAQCQERCIV